MIHEAAAFIQTSELATWPEALKQFRSEIINVSVLASENGYESIL